MEMDIKNMTVEQFISMKEAMDKAEEDTTPYVITDEDDGLQVVGDPNKTEVVKYQYEIQFAYPKTDIVRKSLKDMKDCEVTKETDNYIVCTRTFKDVWIPPRIYPQVQTAFAELYRFFNAITDDGGLRDLTDDEIIEVLKMLDYFRLGWDTTTAEIVIEQGTGDDAGYGVVVLADKYPGECGFMSVARADNCNVTDAHLVELIVPSKVTIDEKHFFVIEQEDGSAKVYFNEALVGQTMIVAYPQKVDVEEYVYDIDNVRYRKTRWSYTRTYTDGVKYRFVFDNVLITSFPDELTDEEGEFEFTVTIQKDATGRYGRAYRILG